MKIKIAGGAYQDEHKRFNAQTCINWYPHYSSPIESIKGPQESGASLYLKPTPGLKTIADAGTNTGVRAVHDSNGRTFFVIGNVFYELIGDNITTHATMTLFETNETQRVFMHENGNGQLGVFGGTYGYYFDLATNVMTQITDVDFCGAVAAEYMDGYSLVVHSDGRVYFSELNDMSDWRGDSIYTPAYEADKTIGLVKMKNLLWNFGHNTIEPYYNDGSAPFTRTVQGSIDIGLFARYSPAKYVGGIFFIGRSGRGSVGVYMLDEKQQVQLISPGSINSRLSEDLAALSCSYGVVEESYDGHIFYHIMVPEAGYTLTYDLITKEWHERQSEKPFNVATGERQSGSWRICGTATHRHKLIAGDIYSGKIFEIDRNTFLEDTLSIRRERIAGIYETDQKRINVSELILNAATGLSNVPSPVLQVSWSVDGGNTFRGVREVPLPSSGSYGERVLVRNLGSGRNWAVKFVLTDEADFAIINAAVRGGVGAR